ncbi:MAG: hypothetical protein ACOVP1_06520 [Bacteroidia bacterium]
MLKDIEQNEVKNIAVAAIFELNPETAVMVWNVYLINYSTEKLEGVIVSSHGWGMINGEEKKTSLLRHFLKEVEPLSYVKIEPIQEDVFGLNSQYWFSAFINGQMIDHKFIFKANQINEENTELISLINQKGIIIYSDNN